MKNETRPVKSAATGQAERFERYLYALRTIAHMEEVDGAISAEAKKIALEALNETGE